MVVRRGPMTDAERIAELERLLRQQMTRGIRFYEWDPRPQQGTVPDYEHWTRWRVDDGIVRGWLVIRFRSAGQAGQRLILNMPPGQPMAELPNMTFGSATYHDLSAGRRYSLAFEKILNDPYRVYLAGESTGNVVWGEIPAVPVGNNDSLRGSFEYPLAGLD